MFVAPPLLITALSSIMDLGSYKPNLSSSICFHRQHASPLSNASLHAPAYASRGLTQRSVSFTIHLVVDQCCCLLVFCLKSCFCFFVFFLVLCSRTIPPLGNFQQPFFMVFTSKIHMTVPII